MSYMSENETTFSSIEDIVQFVSSNALDSDIDSLLTHGLGETRIETYGSDKVAFRYKYYYDKHGHIASYSHMKTTRVQYSHRNHANLNLINMAGSHLPFVRNNPFINIMRILDTHDIPQLSNAIRPGTHVGEWFIIRRVGLPVMEDENSVLAGRQMQVNSYQMNPLKTIDRVARYTQRGFVFHNDTTNRLIRNYLQSPETVRKVYDMTYNSYESVFEPDTAKYWLKMTRHEREHRKHWQYTG